MTLLEWELEVIRKQADGLGDSDSECFRGPRVGMNPESL